MSNPFSQPVSQKSIVFKFLLKNRVSSSKRWRVWEFLKIKKFSLVVSHAYDHTHASTMGLTAGCNWFKECNFRLFSIAFFYLTLALCVRLIFFAFKSLAANNSWGELTREESARFPSNDIIKRHCDWKLCVVCRLDICNLVILSFNDGGDFFVWIIEQMVAWGYFFEF